MLLTKNNITYIWYRTTTPASFASRWLLPLAVREYCRLCDTPEKEVTFEKSGKPYFPAFPGHYLSVTHSRDLLLFAFASFPIGVDAEPEGEEREQVAQRYFTPEEKMLPFAHVWTAREAVAKLTGVGLSDALRVHVSPPKAELDGKSYTLEQFSLEGFCVTVAR